MSRMVTAARQRAADATGVGVPRESVARRIRPLSAPGVFVAAATFCASQLPSLLPRSWLKQGVISGINLLIGYALGVIALHLFRKWRPSKPRHRLRPVSAAAIVVPACVVFVILGARWEVEVRALVEDAPLVGWEPIAAALFSILFAGSLVALVRAGIRWTRRFNRWLARFVGPQAGKIAGTVFSLLVTAALVQGVLVTGTIAWVSSSYTTLDRDTPTGISQPKSGLRSGSAQSLVAWDTLGRFGREFAGVGAGPSQAEISAFSGSTASEPIRVYVGVDSAPTLELRVALVMAELERVGAFERAHLAIITTTGTGWVDGDIVDSFEFVHGGDTAIVAVQYSHVPSWVLFFGDRTTGARTSEAVITAITGHLAGIPRVDRPHVTVVGESLGALGAVQAFADVEDLLDRTDSALLVGPPAADPIRAALTAAREPSTPPWRPIVEAQPEVRFAVEPGDLRGPGIDVVYLQNTSDPVGYTTFALLVSRPEWFNHPRGADVSAAMTWIPIVTFWQSVGDIASAINAHPGHGHSYGADLVDAWVALDPPPGWTDDDTGRLRAIIAERGTERDRRMRG